MDSYQVYLDGELIWFSESEDEKYMIASPTLTMEINKAGSFEFILPKNNIYYEKEMFPLATIVEIYKNGNAFWRGRIISIERDFYLNRKVICEGELGFLNDYTMREEIDFEKNPPDGDPFNQRLAPALEKIMQYAYTSMFTRNVKNSYRILRFAIQSQDEYCGPIKTGDTRYIYKGKVNIGDNLLDCILNAISNFPVFLKVGPDRDPSIPDYYPHGRGVIRIYSLEDQDLKSNQTIEFGKNLLDLNEFIDADSIITAVTVEGKKKSNGERYSFNDYVPNEYQDYPGYGTMISGVLEHMKSVETYGYIIRTLLFDELSKNEDLRKAGLDYLKNKQLLNMNIEISAVDLSSINVDANEFEIGQFVRIKSDPHGIDTNTVCSKIVLDFENPENNKYTFGLKYKTLTEQQASSDKKLSSAYEAAIGSIYQEKDGSST